MRAPARGIALVFLATLLALSSRASAARQVVALFPPDVISAAGDNVLLPAVPAVETAIKEKLAERFDVRPADSPAPMPTDERKRRKARSLGASYMLTGTLSRIGKGVTLDVTLAPVEESGKGRTVVVSGVMDDASPGSPPNAAVFRQLGTEAALRMNVLFFGGGPPAAGGAMNIVPKPAGTITRTSPVPGDVVSIASSDLDRDGKVELVAAYPSDIAIYRLEGDELREKARIPNAGPGLIHVDAKDIDRDGIAEIVAVRYLAGKALSDIWRFDGKGYRKISSALPYFLRTADLGPEGIVLLGQEAGGRSVYQGPVFRLSVQRSGAVDIKDRGRLLPLPEGTFLYAFIPLRWKEEVRYAVLNARDRLVYLDSAGKELWEGLDTLTGTRNVPDRTEEMPLLPGRMSAVDLNRDGKDELVVMNALAAAGTFFENLRVTTQAELLCFEQAGDSLRLAWRSPQADSSGQDLLVDRFGKGGPRFGMASRDRGKILGGTSRWRILWMN